MRAALARLVVPTPPWALECCFCSLLTPVALLAVYVAVVWALSAVVAAVLEEALVSALVLALALALARQAFASLFSGRAWAQSVATVSAPSLAPAALGRTKRLARGARVVLAVAVALLTTRLAGAAR